MMKRLPLILFFLFGAIGFIDCPDAAGQNVPELLYYKFDTPGTTVQNNASTPLGTNPAVITGATISSPGQFGSALTGNGTASGSNSVNTGWTPTLSGPWTISMWFSGITNTLSSSYFFGSTGGTAFRASTGTAEMAGGGNLLLSGTGISNVSANGIFDASGTPVVVHFVYNPSVPDIKVYVNGVFSNAVAQPANLSITGTAPFTVGGYGTNTGLPATGKMDEFRLYNRALSASEISATLNQSLPLVVSPNDAGVSSIISPTSPVIPGVATPITVTVKNYGSSPLTLVPICFRVNNNTVTTMIHTFATPLATNATSAPITIGIHHFPAGPQAICAWSNLINDGNTTNDSTCTTTIACLPLAGTYTINKNMPNTAYNFTSFTAAAQALNSCGVSGPVTINVASGSGPYNEQVVLNAINGTSATNSVTFNGNGNTLLANPGPANLGVITLNGTVHTKFDNFVLNLNAAATTGWGVQLMNGANNNTLSNNTINLPLTSSSTNFNGIATGTTITAAGNHANHTLIQNNTINGGYHAIRLNGNTGGTGATNNQITGNQIRDSYSYNIYLADTDGTLIQGNDISRPTRSSASDYYGVFVTGVNKNTMISKNRFHNAFGGLTSSGSAAYAIYFSSSDAPAGSENIVQNNLIYNMNTNGTIYALYNDGSDGVYYYHNTIDLVNPANTGTVRGLYQTTAASNLKFINNIITISGGASGAKHALYFGTTASSIISNNNVLYATGGANVGYYSTNRPTFANWQAANSNAYDQNSVASDPVFVNASTGNYRPTSLAVSNIGASLSIVTDDITGTPRSTMTPTPGAYEFGASGNDVGVTLISGPVSGCGLTNQETITINIKNYGSNTQTSIPVSYLVNGTPVSMGTWTGTLAPNATTPYTFTSKANLTTPGPYFITARTHLTGDSNPGNDPDTLFVMNSQMPVDSIILNFDTPTTGTSAMRVVTNANSSITESVAASNGAGSAKGLIMAGVNNPGWVTPGSASNAWTSNSSHFSAVYLCFTPSPGKPTDTLRLSFDLKQLYKTSHLNTNFRITVNGQQFGPTYNPPAGGYGSAAAPWTRVELDFSSFLSSQNIEIGLESSVKEEYANGNGTANLIDNFVAERIEGRMAGTGIIDNAFQRNVVVSPNPSAGLFNLKVPATTRSYSVEVTDLTGKIVKKQVVKNNSGTEQLNLNGAAKGIYILKIASEGNVATRKLIVE